MGLTAGQSANEVYVPRDGFLPGAYVNEGKILRAQDINGMTDIPFTIDEDTIGIQLTVQDGQYEKFVMISGKPMRSPDGVITGFGMGARNVDVLCSQVAGFQGELVDDAGRINPMALDALQGRTVIYISYIKGLTDDGKKKWRTWRYAFPPGEKNKEELIALFKEALNDGFVPGYNPSVLGEVSTPAAPPTTSTPPVDATNL